MDRSQISRYKSLDFFARQVVEGFITGRHKKQFEEETNLRCQLVIDQSGSMLFPTERHGDIDQPNKLTFSVYAAAVLIELLHRQRDAFGLSLFSGQIDQQTPCRSSSVHQQYLLGLLEGLLQPVNKDTHRETSLAETIHLTAEQLHKRSMVVLFTDAFVRPDEQEPLFDALRHLRHNKHEVIIFHTYDQAHEVNLDYGSRPHLFIDLESGRQLRLQPDEIAAEYRRQMTDLCSTLRQRAMQYRIDYVPVDVAQGFHQILLPFLLKRSKV